jgi:hypothetical protein
MTFIDSKPAYALRPDPSLPDHVVKNEPLAGVHGPAGYARYRLARASWRVKPSAPTLQHAFADKLIGGCQRLEIFPDAERDGALPGLAAVPARLALWGDEKGGHAATRAI